MKAEEEGGGGGGGGSILGAIGETIVEIAQSTKGLVLGQDSSEAETKQE